MKDTKLRSVAGPAMTRRSLLAMLGGMAGMATIAGLGLTGCSDEGGASAGADAVDYNAMSLEDLIAQAKEEGEVNSVGMPDTWANWVQTWEELNTE